MRPRKKNRNLPPCVYLKHGAYWFVKKGKWKRLASDLPSALREYARLAAAPESGMIALIDKTWPHIIEGLAPSTVEQYRLAANRLKDILAEFTPEQLRPRDVAAIRDHFRETPNQANRFISYLRNVMNYAVDWQIVESNPCVGVRRLPEKKRDRYVTDAEYREIYAQASESLKPIMDICYFTGQRISDVLAIKMSDIDDEGIHFKQGKTGTRLLVKMTPELKAAIDKAKALPRPAQGTTLFCTKRGGNQYNYDTVKNMYRSAVSKAGVERTTLHDLRAKSLTDAKKQGKNAQALGGHSTEAMTNRYIRNRSTIVADAPSFRQSLEKLDKKRNK